MKCTAVLRNIVSIGLALLLLLMTFPVYAEDMTEPVPWTLTREQMTALEIDIQSEPFGDELFKGYEEFGFKRNVESMKANFVYYAFAQDNLVMYTEFFSDLWQPENVEAQAIFDAELDAFTTRYGEPAITDPKECMENFNAVQSTTMFAQSILAYKGWQLDDGSTQHLLMYDDVYDMAVMSIRINNPLIAEKGE